MDLFSGLIGAVLGGAIGGIIGAVLGGRYTLRAAVLAFRLDSEDRRSREEAARQEERQRVRTLLRLELQQNLDIFESFWKAALLQPPYIEGSPTATQLQERVRVVRTPLPAWSHRMWEAQAGVLPRVLDEHQIVMLYALHSDLDFFLTQRQEMENALTVGPYRDLEAKYAEWHRTHLQDRGALWNQEGKPEAPLAKQADEFIRDTQAAWGECGRIHTEATQHCKTLIAVLSRALPTPTVLPAPAAQGTEGWFAKLLAQLRWWPVKD